MSAKRSQQQTRQAKTTKQKTARPNRAGNDRLEQLQQLIQLMAAQDVVEVELEEAGSRWRVRRKEDRPTVTYAAPQAMPAPAPTAPSLAGGAQATAAEEAQGEVFKSPMLGTFYRAASPEAESFVKAGDRVGPDTTLCIIEAMKVMNEIKAEREFTVLEVLVRNGDPVEYGQPMFLIRS